MALTALLTISDFNVHPLYIVESGFNTKLADFILYIQTVIAKRALGPVLYYDFDNDWNGTSFNTQKWTDFVDGYLFTVNGANVKWAGFKDMLKYFVYYEFTKYNKQQQTQLGHIKPNVQNAVIDEDIITSIEMWNNGVNRYGYDWACKFITNPSNIQQFQNYEYEPTLYNFILNRISEFPNWQFKNINAINIFGV